MHSESPRATLARARTALIALALLVAGMVMPQPLRAETLLDNIAGLTLDAEGRLVQFSGLVIGDDGRIAQVLTGKDKRPKKPTYVIDGRGRTVLPGFVDSHVDLMAVGLAELTGGKVDGLPPPRPEDQDIALAKAQAALAAVGITAVADMTTTIEDWQTYRRAGDAGRLYLRIMAYAPDVAAMSLIGGPGPTPWFYGDRLRFNGLRIDLDGSLEDGAALLNGSVGTPRLNDTQLRNLMSRAAIDNFQIAVVAHGDAALTSVLGALDEVSLTYQGDRRWRIENVQLADPETLARAAGHSAALSFRPGRLAADMARAQSSLPSQLWPNVQPWQSAASAGVQPVFGSGPGATIQPPLQSLATAISREDAQGQPYGGWQPQQRLTRETAFAALTVNGARAGHGEGHFGRLVPGEAADFVMVDRDPLLATPAELRTMAVLETWVSGRKVYEAGQEQAQDILRPFGEKMPGW